MSAKPRRARRAQIHKIELPALKMKAPKLVRLGELKPRPQPLEMKRVGIVPVTRETARRQLLRVRNADGFQFPVNDGTGDTNVSFHGGTTAGGVTVQLLFWGD